MHTAVKEGDRLLLDDGLLELVITEKTPRELITRVITGGILGSRKGLSAPGVPLEVEAVTDKDEADVRFGLEQGVDYVALSFVRSAADVHRLKRVMAEVGKSAPIIVKIEKGEAVTNLEEILEVADGAMVARGDLGIEIPMEEIAIAQKHIIRICNRIGKPVITATQMLDSMIRNPRPTRAEVTDIANAVLDGTDALMLSGETAAGAYPFEAVQMMAKVAVCAEREIDHVKLLAEKHSQHGRESITDAISEAVVQVATDQRVKAIVCSTSAGGTARAVARFKPAMPVLAATTRETTYRAMALYWGVTPMLVPFPADTDEMIEQAVEAAVTGNHVVNGDCVVITAGTPVGVPGSTNLLKVHVIGQSLRQAAQSPV
jgi:pyruvate kinase